MRVAYYAENSASMIRTYSSGKKMADEKKNLHCVTTGGDKDVFADIMYSQVWSEQIKVSTSVSGDLFHFPSALRRGSVT